MDSTVMFSLTLLMCVCTIVAEFFICSLLKGIMLCFVKAKHALEFVLNKKEGIKNG